MSHGRAGARAVNLVQDGEQRAHQTGEQGPVGLESQEAGVGAGRRGRRRSTGRAGAARRPGHGATLDRPRRAGALVDLAHRVEVDGVVSTHEVQLHLVVARLVGRLGGAGGGAPINQARGSDGMRSGVSGK